MQWIRNNWASSILIALLLIGMAPMAEQAWQTYATPLAPKGHVQRIGTDGGPVMLNASLDGGNRPYADERDAMCIPWKSLVVFSCRDAAGAPAAATACVSMEDETAVITIGSGPTTGVMTDTDDAGVPSSSANAPCFEIVGRRDVKLIDVWLGGRRQRTSSSLVGVLATQPGQRDGYCSQTYDNDRDPYAGGNRGAPCNNDIDCVSNDAGTGTCTDNAPDQIQCAYVIMEYASPDAGTQEVLCSIDIER